MRTTVWELVHAAEVAHVEIVRVLLFGVRLRRLAAHDNARWRACLRAHFSSEEAPLPNEMPIGRQGERHPGVSDRTAVTRPTHL